MKSKYVLTLEQFEELFDTWAQSWKTLRDNAPGTYTRLKDKLNLTAEETEGKNLKVFSLTEMLPDLLIAVKKIEDKDKPNEEPV